ncbi:amino acid ABC transporter substrate-binding protein (PAAT family) [Crenobacter luteus]|uniref:ABC transporter substrate-binding protein n=1 Tax=Crenobacter luteus TaxID=1452487 RepID=A0A161RCG0_9NEIS|nr:ABC transporter substrate-binding protein [Crenobacter luteus]KZE34948.1 ABC transporter substrate-binding protein [Crenobacter luteus]TCP12106.1 amino acid ABC transporter substrate-binding protein (PAAT family) [Crenobacter luteus]
MKKLVISVALALASTGVMAKEWNVVRFGVDANYAPFESKAADGKLVGFDIDLGNAICEKIKAKCVWVENDFDGMIPALKAKKFDAILSSLSVTDKRKEQIAFSDKLFNTPVRLVARKGSSLQPTVESLKGKRIGVQQGTVMESFAKAHWGGKGVTVVPYQNNDLVLADLVSGRLDGSVQEVVLADTAFLKTAQGRNFGFAGGNLNDVKILGVGTAVGLRKEDNDLRLLINKAIADMHKDGTYQRLSKKYFSFDIYH